MLIDHVALSLPLPSKELLASESRLPQSFSVFVYRASLTQKLDQGGAAYLASSMLHMIRAKKKESAQRLAPGGWPSLILCLRCWLFWLRLKTVTTQQDKSAYFGDIWSTQDKNLNLFLLLFQATFSSKLNLQNLVHHGDSISKMAFV